MELLCRGVALTLQQSAIRIGEGARCDLVIGGYGDYTYLRLWWKDRELWAVGCGSMHIFEINGEQLPPQKAVRLASGERLGIQRAPTVIVEVRF